MWRGPALLTSSLLVLRLPKAAPLHCVATGPTVPPPGMGLPLPPLAVCYSTSSTGGVSVEAHGLPFSMVVQSDLEGCSTSGAVSVVS